MFFFDCLTTIIYLRESLVYKEKNLIKMKNTTIIMSRKMSYVFYTISLTNCFKFSANKPTVIKNYTHIV